MGDRKKINKIDQILKDLYLKVKIDNVDLEYKQVYEYLKQINVNEDEKAKNMDSVDLEKLRNKLNNIDNFDTHEDGHFMFFKKKVINYEDYVGADCIKIYVPLDYNHIYKGTNKIIDFLNKNNIVHNSKVAKYMRFDNIVIRVNTIEDAKKIQNFVNNDPYIKEGMIEGNPFAFSDKGCSFAFDGGGSYNYCVAKLIADFIELMAKESKFTVDDVNAENFYNWISTFSNNLEAISNYMYLSFPCDDVTIRNTKRYTYFIINLIKLAISSDNMDDYYNYIKVCKNEDINSKVYFAIFEDEKYLDFNELISYKKDEKAEKEELFNELILTTMQKFPRGFNKERPNISGYDYLRSFMGGHIDSVTRDNNLRARVKESCLNQDDIYEIVDESRVVDLPSNNIRRKLNIYIKVVMLNNIIFSMKIADSYRYLERIDEFVKTNNSNLIPINVRKLSATLDSKAIQELFLDLGVSDIYEYEENYYGQRNSKGRKR